MGLSDFLTQTAYISSVNGRDGVGSPTFGTPVSVKCKFRKQFAMEDGNLSGVTTYVDTPDAVMYVKKSVSIDTDDSVEYDGEPYRIVDILDQVGTITTLDHKKILLKKYA